MSTPTTVTAGTELLFVPKLCSEREADGSWEDCTWAGGVMLANFLLGKSAKPSTRTEYEALRKAGTGTAEIDGKGNSIDDLIRGMENRYGFSGTKIETWAEYETWPVGSGFSVQGLYGKLPSRLRRTGFTGAHNVFVIKDTNDDGHVWMDPLGISGESFRRITTAELKAFFTSLPGARMLAGRQGDPYRSTGMIKMNTQRWSAPKGEPIYEFPNGPKVTSMAEAKTVTTIGYFMDRLKDTTPFVIGGWRAILVNSVAIDGAKAPKIAAIKTGNLKAVASPPGWDAEVWKLLTDPTLTVDVPAPPPVVPVDSAALTKAFNEGVTAAAVKAATAKKVI